MGDSKLTSQLIEIKNNLDDQNFLLQLQQLLTNPHYTQELLTTMPNREIINQILASLKPAILKSNVFHKIKSTRAKVKKKLMQGARVKSLHDRFGRFIWFQEDAQDIFDMNQADLKRSTLFQLMSKKSRQHLYTKYGIFIGDSSKSRVFTYQLAQSGLQLSSRVSLVMYSEENRNIWYIGIFCQTRLARHQLVEEKQQRIISPLFSPQIAGLEVPSGFGGGDSRFLFRGSPDSMNFTPIIKQQDTEDTRDKPKRDVNITEFW